MRIGAVLHPTVFLALADGTSVMKDVNRPPAYRPYRRPSFTCHQHGNGSWTANRFVRHSFRRITHGWDSQRRELNILFESLTRRHSVPELGLPGLSFGRVRQVPQRALVNRAERRLGHPASIPHAIMSRSPEALALGPAVISFRRRYHCPSFGCLLNRSRDCTRSRVPPLSRRRYADPPAGASFSCLRFAPALFGARETALSAALKSASRVVSLSGRPSRQKDSCANAQSVFPSEPLRVRVRAGSAATG
jgi:hypothetical protein